MKRYVLMAAAGLAVCLLSCKSKQAVVTEQNRTVSVTDTTKVNITAATHLRTRIDTTKTAGQFEGGGMVEFVECGGTVSIDTAGNIKMDGVKNIKGNRRGSFAQDKGITQAEEVTAGHTEQLNGVTTDQTNHVKQTEEKKQGKTWYEEILISVGALCCIALLMWLLFLYLKQKK